MEFRKTSQDPVTVLAEHRVRPGSEQAFERWMEGISADSKGFAGYLGTEVISPLDDADDAYVSIFRFDNYAHLDAWLKSPERQAWLDKHHEFSDEPASLRYHSLEFLFSPEEHAGRAPSKHKMALVTFVVIWPLVHFVPVPLAWVLGASPPIVMEATSVGVIVLLMTYAVMPGVTRLLAPWLFGRPTAG